MSKPEVEVIDVTTESRESDPRLKPLRKWTDADWEADAQQQQGELERQEEDDTQAEAARVAQEEAAYAVLRQTSSCVSMVTADPDTLREIQKIWLNGEQFDAVRIASEVKGFILTMANALVEIGRRFCAVKDACGHGNFLEWIESNSLPFSERNIQRHMAVAQAVQQRPELRRLAGMGLTKANLILSLPEECLEELAEEGTIAGESIDRFEALTRNDLLQEVRTLKKKVTDAAKQLHATRDDLTVKVQDNIQLRKQNLELISGDTSPSEIEADLRSRMTNFQLMAEQHLRTLERVDLGKLSEDGRGRLGAFVVWLLYRVTRTDIVLREKLTDFGWVVPQVTGAEMATNDERKAQFEGTWDVDPLGGGEA